jgi:hypothetical protein
MAMMGSLLIMLCCAKTNHTIIYQHDQMLGDNITDDIYDVKTIKILGGRATSKRTSPGDKLSVKPMLPGTHIFMRCAIQNICRAFLRASFCTSRESSAFQ